VVAAWAEYCSLIPHACQLKKNDVLLSSSVDKAQVRSLPLRVGELEAVSFLHLCECPHQKKNVNVWYEKRLPRHTGFLLLGGERERGFWT
jgi:hypothetical protein